MSNLLTPRKLHTYRLSRVAGLSGTYYRKMSYDESSSFLNAYSTYVDEGYPRDIALQYAWDFYFAGRRSF